jgi:cytochrome c-type biogenesis protein CcmH/NrfG
VKGLNVFAKSAVCTVIGAALFVSLPGCADNITYAHDAENKGMEYYNKQQYSDAAAAFRNAARQNPREYKAHYYLAASEDALGNYQEAMVSYKACLDVMNTTLEGRYDYPLRDKVLSALADDIAKSANRDAEIANLQNHATSTKNPEFYILLARIYRNSGDADSALDAYNKATLIDPKDSSNQKEYGLYLEQLGLKDRAASQRQGQTQ